jgi:hypothetical protein
VVLDRMCGMAPPEMRSVLMERDAE